MSSPIRHLAALLLLAGASCAQRAPADRTPSSSPTVRVTAAEARPPSEPAVTGWRVVARGASRAIALDADRVYFGDESSGALYGAPKVGGPPTAIGAPPPRDIALGPGSVVWVGEPGNVVVRAARTGGPRQIVRDRGDFSAVAAGGPDVYVAEITGRTGALTRVHGPTAGRVAAFDSPPRALAIDDVNVYVQTERSIVRITRATGEASAVLEGAALSRLVMDGEFLYTTDEKGPSRAVVRVPKIGGYGFNVIEHAVRDAPIAVLRGDVYYFEADQPTLRRVSITGGASTIVARAPELGRITAMAIDASGIFVASDSVPLGGRGEQVGSAVIAMPVVAMPEPAPR